MELAIANGEAKVKSVTEQCDYLTEQLAVQTTNLNEKVNHISEIENEIESLKTVHECVINQKKEYIKKLFVEMDELRATIEQKV